MATAASLYPIGQTTFRTSRTTMLGQFVGGLTKMGMMKRISGKRGTEWPSGPF